MIADALQPLMTEQHDWIILFTLAILFVYSVLGIIKYVVDYKKTGIAIYCTVFPNMTNWFNHFHHSILRSEHSVSFHG